MEKSKRYLEHCQTSVMERLVNIVRHLADNYVLEKCYHTCLTRFYSFWILLTLQKMKNSITGFFSKCDLIENFIFCAGQNTPKKYIIDLKKHFLPTSLLGEITKRGQFLGQSHQILWIKTFIFDF